MIYMNELHLMCNNTMVFLPYKFLLESCKSSHQFLSVLKIVRRSPARHDKLIYMNAYKPNQAWKL